LHKHVIDPITWPCDQEGCSGIMTRVPEVLDCWFESGSMPYAQLHYPFENQARFDATFPAEFIAEGLDQTRGWFYTLHVLATAIFDAPAFKNCVVNGMILADDGRKMSKSLHNYPDPNQIFDEFGADALRAFLINSPVLRAEPLRFSEDGVREVVRTVMLPLWNTYSFFTTYAEADGLTMTDIDSAPPPDERPETDRWILSVLQSLVAEVNTKMEGYYLYDVVPPTIGFIDDLTNWYVRRSRRRFWRTKTADDADKLAAFATLYEVLVTFSKVLAPVLPFITEKLYQGLVVDRGIEAPDSVHHCDFPQAVSELIDADLEDAMQVVRRVVTAGRALRSRQAIGIRQPLSKLTVLTRSSIATRAVETHITLISDELNVKEVVTSSDEGALVVLSAKANFKTLGPRFGAEVRAMDAAISTLDSSTLEALVEGGTIQVAGHVLEAADVVISRVPREGVIVGTDGELSVALDVILNDRLVSEGLARDVVSKVQALRRDAGLDVSDRISLVWWTDDSDLAGAIADFGAVIAAETLSLSIQQNPDAPTDERIGDRRIKLGVERVT
ncbi:MAG TPA: isoleucine--tRNA ligase, partial [Actinobacteria bacterium]|nr:isoleucine--tRNA ligase [Actinomycetota bacterium]